jgi:RimJ/RimL family protein N-acetyltransferase
MTVLPASDGVITLRPFAVDDRAAIVAGRDDEWQRWLGPGTASPSPTACIEAGGVVVGWIDADAEPTWLDPGEVNVGYSIFPAHRGYGYAARAVRLLAGALREQGHRRALLVIDRQNHASLGVARSAGAHEDTARSFPQFRSSAVHTIELGDRPDASASSARRE